MEESQQQENTKSSSSIKKNGYYLKKKTAKIGLAVLIAVFIVALLIIYYSAKPSAKELAEKCSSIRASTPAVYTITDVAVSPATTSIFDSIKMCRASVCRMPTLALGTKIYHQNILS